MTPPSTLRTVFWILCAAALLVGLLLAISPWLADGGFLGWFLKLEDMQQSDLVPLQLLQWATRIGLGLVSAAMGVVIMLVAGVVAIATGLVASLVRLGKATQEGKSKKS